jgi:hypothetical protein
MSRMEEEVVGESSKRMKPSRGKKAGAEEVVSKLAVRIVIEGAQVGRRKLQVEQLDEVSSALEEEPTCDWSREKAEHEGGGRGRVREL